MSKLPFLNLYRTNFEFELSVVIHSRLHPFRELEILILQVAVSRTD